MDSISASTGVKAGRKGGGWLNGQAGPEERQERQRTRRTPYFKPGLYVDSRFRTFLAILDTCWFACRLSLYGRRWSPPIPDATAEFGRPPLLATGLAGCVSSVRCYPQKNRYARNIPSVSKPCNALSLLVELGIF